MKIYKTSLISYQILQNSLLVAFRNEFPRYGFNKMEFVGRNEMICFEFDFFRCYTLQTIQFTL